MSHVSQILLSLRDLREGKQPNSLQQRRDCNDAMNFRDMS